MCKRADTTYTQAETEAKEMLTKTNEEGRDGERTSK